MTESTALLVNEVLPDKPIRTNLQRSVPIPRHFINNERTWRPETNYGQSFSTTNMAFILPVLPRLDISAENLKAYEARQKNAATKDE
jgi:hypothetical protein